MTRRRPGATASFDTVQPDPSQVGGVAEAPFIRLPDPAALFSHRARRLEALAPGHILEPYLALLARLAATQAALAPGLRPAPIDPAALAQRAEHGFPPIAPEQLRHGLPDLITRFLTAFDPGPAPEPARAALETLRTLDDAARLALAEDVFGAGPPVDRIAQSLFIAAPLQLHLAALAATLSPAAIQPAAEGVCPVCGGPPVASVVVGWTQASKARYCACALCGSLWNHVRIKCTACGSTEGIAYLGIEEAPGPVGAETCSICHTYLKHMQQHDTPALDPLADDVASYALDLLVQQDGFRRAAYNPLFLTF